MVAPATAPSSMTTSSTTQDEFRVTFSALEHLGPPTLLVTGDADPFTPPAVLRLFKQHMPAAEFLVVPESGHAAYWENPEVFNEAVLEFLGRQ